MESKLSIGQKVKKFRIRAGVSQMDLELAIGAASGSISRIEVEKVNPTKETLLSIAQVLHLTSTETSYLLGIGHDDPTPEDIARAKKEVANLMASPQVFAYLLDNKARMVEVSQGFKDFFANSFNTDVLIGHHINEIIFNPELKIMDALASESVELMAKVTAAVFKQEREYLLDEPWWKETVARILEYPLFRKYWEIEDSEYIDLLAPDMRIAYFKINEQKQKMIYHHTLLSMDNRFMIVEYTAIY